jgi:hypothetical protein
VIAPGSHRKSVQGTQLSHQIGTIVRVRFKSEEEPQDEPVVISGGQR